MGAAAGDVRPLDRPHDLMRNPARQGNRQDGRGRSERPPEDTARRVEAGAGPGARWRKTTTSSDRPSPRSSHYKRAHPQLVDLKGIGIYAPFITDQGILDRLELAPQPKDGEGSLKSGTEKTMRSSHSSKAERRETRNTWPRLVYEGLKRTIPAELMVEIDGIGELQDRRPRRRGPDHHVDRECPQWPGPRDQNRQARDRGSYRAEADDIRARNLLVPAELSRQPLRRRLARRGCASFRRSARRC